MRRWSDLNYFRFTSGKQADSSGYIRVHPDKSGSGLLSIWSFLFPKCMTHGKNLTSRRPLCGHRYCIWDLKTYTFVGISGNTSHSGSKYWSKNVLEDCPLLWVNKDLPMPSSSLSWTTHFIAKSLWVLWGHSQSTFDKQEGGWLAKNLPTLLVEYYYDYLDR